MANKQKELLDNADDLYKQFDEDFESMLNLFMNNLREIPLESDRSDKKPEFVKMLTRHINIFYYNIDKKTLLTLYMNFGKEQEKVLKLMKCQGNLLFKDGVDNFAPQILLTNIQNISPYVFYLLELIHTQFMLLGTFSNLNEHSPLKIMEKKTKAILKDFSICLRNDVRCPVNLKGLGSSGFIVFTVKQLNFYFEFELENKKHIYRVGKNKINDLLGKEKGAKGQQDCKDLIKWVENNKLNYNRTTYSIMPCQFIFSRVSLGESALAKRYKKDYEKDSELCGDLEAYIVKKKTKVINVNTKFCVLVRMKFSPENEESISDFDVFNEEVVFVSEAEKQNKINTLHNEFVKNFKNLLQDGTIEEIDTGKNTIDIKDKILNSYERVTPTTSSNNKVPLIVDPKARNDDELTDVEDDDNDDNENIVNRIIDDDDN